MARPSIEPSLPTAKRTLKPLGHAFFLVSATLVSFFLTASLFRCIKKAELHLFFAMRTIDGCPLLIKCVNKKKAVAIRNHSKKREAIESAR